jgi:hypothetical protein
MAGAEAPLGSDELPALDGKRLGRRDHHDRRGDGSATRRAITPASAANGPLSIARATRHRRVEQRQGMPGRWRVEHHMLGSRARPEPRGTRGVTEQRQFARPGAASTK